MPALTWDTMLRSFRNRRHERRRMFATRLPSVHRGGRTDTSGGIGTAQTGPAQDELLPAPRRVLFVASIPQTLEAFVSPLARHLTALGYHVSAAASPAPTAPAFRQTYALPPIRRAGPRAMWQFAWRLMRTVRLDRPDVIHLHTPQVLVVGRIVARLTGVRVVSVVHGSLFEDKSPKGQVFRFLEFCTARLSDTTIVLNADDEADYRRLVGRFGEVRRAPSGGMGVPLERIDAQRAAAGRAEQYDVVYLGRLDRAKGLEVLDAVAELLATAAGRPVLHVFGAAMPGDDAWEPASDKIVLHGWSAVPEKVLAGARVVLLPSPREGFSLVTAEALLSGARVVAVSNRGTREIAHLVPDVKLLPPGAKAPEFARLLVQALAQTPVHVPAAIARRWSREEAVRFHTATLAAVFEREAGRGRAKGLPPRTGAT
jgi:glycosyltransferase involved in cell wall biosynthesis